MTTAYSRYDQIAKTYDRAIRPLENWFLRELRKEAIEVLPKYGRILELGAGTGLNFGFYDRSMEVIAAEPSCGMIRIARCRKGDSIELVRSCAEHLPFKNASFDSALATLVLCSVQSPTEAFAELRRVIKPGGTISLVEHVRPSGILGPVFDLLNLITVPLMEDHVNRRTSRLAAEAGLTIQKVRSVGAGIFDVITCVN